MKILGHLGMCFDPAVVFFQEFFLFTQIGSGHTMAQQQNVYSQGCQKYPKFQMRLADDFGPNNFGVFWMKTLLYCASIAHVSDKAVATTC